MKVALDRHSCLFEKVPFDYVFFLKKRQNVLKLWIRHLVETFSNPKKLSKALFESSLIQTLFRWNEKCSSDRKSYGGRMVQSKNGGGKHMPTTRDVYVSVGSGVETWWPGHEFIFIHPDSSSFDMEPMSCIRIWHQLWKEWFDSVFGFKIKYGVYY